MHIWQTCNSSEGVWAGKVCDSIKAFVEKSCRQWLSTGVRVKRMIKRFISEAVNQRQLHLMENFSLGHDPLLTLTSYGFVI